MKSFKNLTIIGTSHISIESVKQVEKTILEQKPAIVALELDKDRFLSLFHKKKISALQAIKSFGVKGFLLNLVGAYIEKKLGKMVGVAPGSEMKKAAKTAKKINAKIALIDQHIRITMRNLSKNITLREKLRFFKDILKAIIFRTSEFKEVEKIDLTKVPDEKLIRKLTKSLKQKYPSLYKILIDDRNKIMANNLYKLILINPNERIVAVVGAGHEEEMISILEKRFIK